MAVAYPSLIPNPFPSSSPFPRSSRNHHSLPFSVPSPPKAPSFRSKQHQRAFVSMALPSSSSPPLTGTSDAELKVPDSGVIGSNDLLIIGPGVLGRIVAEKWRQDHPDSQICGQTMTSDHHDELIEIGIKPSLRGSITDNKFPYVIFCAPPPRTEDYPGDVRLAASNWNGEGSFLFTSSTAVYECCDNGPCNEDSPLVPIGRSSRVDVLLRAEDVVQEVGGCVLRLAGLYISFLNVVSYISVIFSGCLLTKIYRILSKAIFIFHYLVFLNNEYKADRGAHTFWLEKGTVPSRPDHFLNLIHYEDAASLAVAIMKKKLRNQTFLGCDDRPLTRQEVMDCVKRSGKFSKEFQGFTGTDGPLGKRMNNSKTRAEVGWEPKYASFFQFFGLSE